MTHHRLLLLNLLLLVAVPGCSLVQNFFSWLGPPETVTINAPMRDSSLLRLTSAIRPVMDELLAATQVPLIQAHQTVDAVDARYKRSLTVMALKQPWEGLSHLERQGLLLAELAEGGAINLAGLLDVLEAGMDRTSAFHRPVSVPAKLTVNDVVNFMLESLEVGEARVAPMLVLAYELRLQDGEGEGLLGRDFLERFDMRIDMEGQVVILSPR